MNFIAIKGNSEDEFQANLSKKLFSINASYVSNGIETFELETNSKIILFANAPQDDEFTWEADQDFALLYKRDLDNKYIEIVWFKKKWILGKLRTQQEIDEYLKNESVEDRIFFIEFEK